MTLLRWPGSYDCLYGESTRNPQIDKILEVFGFWFGEHGGGVEEEMDFGEGCGEGESVGSEKWKKKKRVKREVVNAEQLLSFLFRSKVLFQVKFCEWEFKLIYVFIFFYDIYFLRTFLHMIFHVKNSWEIFIYNYSYNLIIYNNIYLKYNLI